MANKGKVKVGIIGSQFEADIHAASFQMMPEEAEVVAIASPTLGHAERLARKYDIERVFLDYREMLAHYPGARTTLIEGSDHAISEFADYVDDVLAFCDAEDVEPPAPREAA